ncbi:MAG TPA: PH domain-containing protein [Candidatus Sulfomarinibacteraceae bacterium]|nr:PH domain-containing protein [Candidatus Sulfomarinibacteraceae bacterium]
MPRYADTLLSDGERITLRTRQHWLATIVDGRVPWAIFLAALVLVAITVGMDPGGIRDLLGYGIAIVLVVSLAWLGKHYWSWYAQDYIVTNRRVLKVEGILNKRSADSSLEKINDAVLVQNLFGRIFGYGDLDILTAADVAIDKFRMLDNAPGFKKAMLDEKHSLETEFAHQPGPPLRAPGTGGAPPRPMTADEVTRALGDLATLRDRGALSVDEYEAKKRDLLARL